MGSVFLVGLMGAGKTTVGRLLAKRLGWRFVDADQEIESRTGVPVATIFEIEGEEGFRDREAKVIAELTKQPDIVLATGGGAVLSQDSRRAMKEGGFVVYLYATPEVLYERTKTDKTRPLLQVDDRLGKLRSLYVVRDPLYREVASFTVEVGRNQASQIVRRIQRALPDKCEQ